QSYMDSNPLKGGTLKNLIAGCPDANRQRCGLPDGRLAEKVQLQGPGKVEAEVYALLTSERV
ncbi:MAG TPA: hypothetical protein VF182_16435, partial [Candidatus Binatia bacterium]